MQKTIPISIKHILTIISLFLIPTLSNAEPATTESIREYFKISGHEGAVKANAEKLIPKIRQAAGNMPEDLFAELSRTDNLIDKFIPIYQKYLSEQDVQGLITFYKTQAGMNFAKAYPKMEEEIMLKMITEAQMTITNYYIQKGNFTVDKK